MLRRKQLGAALISAFDQRGLQGNREIRRWLEERGVAISQPTLSKLLSGKYRRCPKSLRKVCRALELDWRKYTQEVNPCKSVLLLSALRYAWNGAPDTERFLSRLITAAGELLSDYGVPHSTSVGEGLMAGRPPSRDALPRSLRKDRENYPR